MITSSDDEPPQPKEAVTPPTTMSSVTIDNDEPIPGRRGADMTMVRLFFGNLSFEEVERAGREENHKM